MGRQANPKPSQTSRRLATTLETAAYLHCGERTVRRLIADGTLQGHRLGKRLVRLDLDEVDEALVRMPSAATQKRGGIG